MDHLPFANRVSRGLDAISSVLLLALSAAAQVVPYGTGLTTPGSLVVTSGSLQVGKSFSLGVSNTARSSATAALAFVAFASAPDSAFPAGTPLPGFGLSFPGALGELLISLVPPDPFITLGPVAWAGGTTPPAAFTVAVPPKVALIGLTFYAQGLLLDLAGGPSVGLTDGLALTIGAPLAVALVPIQAGTFQMGSNAAYGTPYFQSDASKPVHSVTISYDFWMGKTEVTQAQYQELMATNPSAFLGATHPVESVTWFDAQAYCAALTAQEAALGNVPPGHQYRLPTEAEWEYACRAGTTTEFNVGSDLFCNQANFGFSFHSNSSCNSGATMPVGSYAPNPWGLYDMHGNVWEWCLDSYAGYPATAVTDPFVTGGTFRVLRGGASIHSSATCRSAFRQFFVPNDSLSDIGFRVVLGPILVP